MIGKRKHGWIRDSIDPRDYPYVPRLALTPKTLPDITDLRNEMPSVYDQEQIGSCTAQACVAMFEHLHFKTVLIKHQISKYFPLSRLFAYYNARAKEGTANSDSGAQIRDVAICMAQLGVCREGRWPYDPHHLFLKPGPDCYKQGLNYQATQYERVPNMGAGALFYMKSCLAEGFPFVCGVLVFDSFMAATNGNIPLPNVQHEKCLGGHAICIVGYDDANQKFIFRNSWNTTWGQMGYGTIPYSFLLNNDLANDFWTFRKVE